MSDTTLQDVTNAVAAGNAGMYKKVVPQWAVFRSQESGEILMVNGITYFWITDINVLNLFRVVGLAEEETRNYDDNVNAWIKTLDDATDAVSRATAADAAESRRMLGVLLGWSNGQEGSPELSHSQLIKSTPLQCVMDGDPKAEGATYAVGPNTFYHLVSEAEVTAMRNTGILSRNTWTLDHETLVAVQKVIAKAQKIEGIFTPEEAPKV